MMFNMYSERTAENLGKCFMSDPTCKLFYMAFPVTFSYVIRLVNNSFFLPGKVSIYPQVHACVNQ